MMIHRVLGNVRRWQGMVWVLILVMGLSFTPGWERYGLAQEIDTRLTLRTDKPRSNLVSLIFSPDGKTIACAYGKKSGLELWDLAKGKARMVLNKRDEPIWVQSVAFSPDGKTLAVGCTHSVRLLDAATGKEKAALLTDEHPSFQSLAFAPDGETLAVGVSTETVVLLDPRSRKVRAKLAGHETEAYCLAFSPDGKLLASSEDRGESIYLWDVATGTKRATFKPRKDGSDYGHSWQVAFTPDGNTLAAGCSFGTVKLLDVKSGQVNAILHEPRSDDIFDVALSPDGRTLAAADNRGAIHLWEMVTKMERATLRGPKRSKFPIAFSPDGRTLASGCIDGAIKLWDLAGVKRKPPDVSEMVRLWSDLESHDAARAYQAIRTLTAFPAQTLSFLGKHLQSAKPPPEPLAWKIERWLADLDSNDFATRQKAGEELEKLGASAESAVRQALTRRPSPETRRRLAAILERIERDKAAEQLQQLRALEVLEHIGTAEARTLLEQLAKGVPEARLTQESKASLLRLRKRPTAAP